jgi:uncharacterized protein YbjQ (UPF0145 family)
MIASELGKEIHQQTLQRYEEEQRNSMQATVQALRAEAEEERNNAVIRAEQAAKWEQEKAIKNISQKHEKALKVCAFFSFKL